ARVRADDHLELLEHIELLEGLSPEGIDALVRRRGRVKRLHHLADRHLVEVNDGLSNLRKVVALREPALATPACVAPADHQHAELLLRVAVRAGDMRRSDEDPGIEGKLIHPNLRGCRAAKRSSIAPEPSSLIG